MFYSCCVLPGFVPKFMIPRLPYFKFGPEIGCLVYFDVESDASKIRWARATNNMQAVKQAVSGNRCFFFF